MKLLLPLSFSELGKPWNQSGDSDLAKPSADCCQHRRLSQQHTDSAPPQLQTVCRRMTKKPISDHETPPRTGADRDLSLVVRRIIDNGETLKSQVCIEQLRDCGHVTSFSRLFLHLLNGHAYCVRQLWKFDEMAYAKRPQVQVLWLSEFSFSPLNHRKLRNRWIVVNCWSPWLSMSLTTENTCRSGSPRVIDQSITFEWVS